MADNYQAGYSNVSLSNQRQKSRRSEFRNHYKSGYSSSPNLDLSSLHIYENNLDLYRAKSILSNDYSESMNSLGNDNQDKANIRKESFLDSFSNTMSILYALLLIVVGLVVYIFDLFGPKSKIESQPVGVLGEAFDLYLCLVGIIIISFLIFDITKYLDIVKQYQNHEEAPIRLIEDENGDLIISIPLNQEANQTKLPEYYLFSSKRHAGSFFFKIGATVFWLGHTIHMLIIFTREILYLQHSHNGTEYAQNDCFNPVALINSLLQMFYFLLQNAVIIKFSNVIVNRSKRLARFCFMHCLASSVCLWIRAITNETEDFVVKSLLDENSNNFGGCEKYDDSCNGSSFNIEMDCIYHKICHCLESSKLVQEAYDYTYYFYAFTIEFSILSAGVWYIMWTKIGKVSQHKDEIKLMPSNFGTYEAVENFKRTMVISVDCTNAIKGFFSGIFFLILALIGMTVYVMYSSVCSECSDSDACLQGPILNNAIEIVLFCLMLFATIMTYYNFAHLDINYNPVSFLDNALLLTCLPGFLLYGLFNGIADADSFHSSSQARVAFFLNFLMIAQVLIQTPAIIDGLQRCSNTSLNQENKPGKNYVTFLIISNLAIYFWDTVEAKTPLSYWNVPGNTGYYGTDFNTILNHFCSPMMSFYRFHSAVALADIWSSAYKTDD